MPVEQGSHQLKKTVQKDKNEDTYDPNDDEDEKLLAAPLAKMKDIERKKQSILSQNSGTSFDDVKSEQTTPTNDKAEKHSSKAKEDKVMDIK